MVVTNTSAGLVLQSATASQGVTTTNGGGHQQPWFVWHQRHRHHRHRCQARCCWHGLGHGDGCRKRHRSQLRRTNTAVISTSNTQPSADLAIGIVGDPSPAIVGSNILFTLNVTNTGPGKSLDTVVFVTLMGSANFQNISLSKGTFNFGANTVARQFGDLVSNETVTASILVTPPRAAFDQLLLPPSRPPAIPTSRTTWLPPSFLC